MKKNYLIWWHTRYIDDIDRNATTIKEILSNAHKTLGELEKLKVFEDEGKIRVRNTGSLNPLYIEILDSSVESEVASNPIVEVEMS